jgi:hypothetical protein
MTDPQPAQSERQCRYPTCPCPEPSEPGGCQANNPPAGIDTVGERRYQPPNERVEYRCRWCGRKLGEWHDKECSPGQCGDGRVHDRDCSRFTYVLHVADARLHMMHEQLRAAWERG